MLLLTLLLSTTIGITAGKKPDKPGKPEEPSPDLVVADFEIRIGVGIGTQDITLNSPEFLDVQDEVGGYWLPPPTKGKAIREGWGVGLRVDEGEDCGTYIIEDDEGLPEILTLKGVNSVTEAYSFNIFHDADINPQNGVHDYWRIAIRWEIGEPLPVPGSDPPYYCPHILGLDGYTSKDIEWEGVYDEGDDKWTVTFNNEWFTLWENTEDPQVHKNLWIGQLSSTVEIQRILP